MRAIRKSHRGNQAAPKNIRTPARAPEAGDEKSELWVALAEHRADLMAGRFFAESVRAHLVRLTRLSYGLHAALRSND